MSRNHFRFLSRGHRRPEAGPGDRAAPRHAPVHAPSPAHTPHAPSPAHAPHATTPHSAPAAPESPHVPSVADAAAMVPPAGDRAAFDLLPEPLRRAVAEEGYTTPTPIQAQSIPHLLAGRDLLGCAQTGTGKTAAFVLPMLRHLAETPRRPTPGHPRVLILAPTRELAAQIGDSIRNYGRHVRVSHTVIFGGVGQGPQINALRRGVDIVVATPGRLLDLCGQGHVRFGAVEVFVLDEADRMLDMGFIPDVRRIVEKLPERRQSLFFSATLPRDVVDLARTLVHDPVHVTVTPEQPTVERIAQKVLFVDKGNKDALLARLLLDTGADKVLVFTEMKHIANRVAEKLSAAGIPTAAIHGNKSQNARTEALGLFKAGRVRVLVATDIAARGIDVDGITHVVNYQLPKDPHTYVHRIGRTARAGAEGDAVSFCCAEERDYLRQIERTIRKAVPADLGHAFHSEAARAATGAAARPPPKAPHGPRAGHRPHGGPRAAHPHGPPRPHGAGHPHGAPRPNGPHVSDSAHVHVHAHASRPAHTPGAHGTRPRHPSHGHAASHRPDHSAGHGPRRPHGASAGRH